MNFDDLVHSGIYFQALRLALDLEIFERIEDGKNTYEDLRNSLSLSSEQRSLRALLYLLEELGLVLSDTGSLQNTKLTKKKLLRGSVASEIDLIKFIDDQFIKEIKSCGKRILVEGVSPAPVQRPWEKPKDELDETFYENSQKAKLLSDSLSKKAAEAGKNLSDLVTFKEFSTVVDIGGNDGSFIIPILKKFKELKGEVFDLPVLKSKAIINIKENKLDHRLSYRDGSFFHNEIPQADCYLLRLVLHDFSDESCLRILESISRKMGEKEKLIIVENVIDNPVAKERKHILAANLYLTLHGEFYGHQSRERTTKEYEKLVLESGLKVLKKKYQKNLILVCGKEERTSLPIIASSERDIFICNAVGALGNKNISIKLDANGNLTSITIKGLFSTKEMCLSGANEIYAINYFGFFIKSLSVIDKGEYFHNDEGSDYTGRKVEITYLKRFFPKLKYARQTVFIKKVDGTWGLYDFEDKKIEII